MPKLKNAFVRWRHLRDGGPWSTTDSGNHRHTDRMILAIAAWCCSWAAGEFVLAEPERVFNSYSVGYIAGAILTGLSACYVVSRLVSRGYAFAPFTATAFGTASKAIEQRESEEGLIPSQPQIDIGSAIRPKLNEIGKRLLQLHGDQVADKQTSRPAPTFSTQDANPIPQSQ